MNSRALYQKVLPKTRSLANKKKQPQEGEDLSMDKDNSKVLKRSYSLGAQYVTTDTMSQAEKDSMEAGPSNRPDYDQGKLYRNWTSEEDLSAAETNYYGYPKDLSCTEDLSQSELSMPELD
ncbi:hypothetical protein B566_EDAN002354 [Ephemera danica]|nr:hypothetical protein B566_EDAN002354 [Ephemera danica]